MKPFRRVPLKKRVSRTTLSLLALFVTFLPLLSLGWWVYSTYFSDPRDVKQLQVIQKPAVAPALFDEPLVSVTFDDGWESIYRNGVPILQKYGIRTTQYVLSGTFKHPRYLSKAQVVSMQQAGHDIQSHTVTHSDLTTLDDEDLAVELGNSQREISKVIGHEVKDFASPLNRYDDDIIAELKKYYRSHRTTDADVFALNGSAFNQRGTFDPFHITAFSVRRTTTTEQIKNFLAAAKAQKAWAILIYHEVEDDSQDYYAVTKKQLDEQMAAIKDSGIRTATIAEVIDVYYANPAAYTFKRETE